jgi:hypothetical protein
VANQKRTQEKPGDGHKDLLADGGFKNYRVTHKNLSFVVVQI